MDASGETAQHTLLLVDDEENILASLRRLLRKDGYRILCAGSGQAGLEVLAQEPKVDIIISDQRMPFMTGTEFLKKARELSPDSIRIILSGYTDLESVTSAINEGAVYKFLTKPWEDEILRLALREALAHKWVQDENRLLQAMQVEVAEEFAQTIQRLRAQLAEAEQGRETLQQVLSSLPLPLFVFDRADRLLMASDRALDLCGLSMAALPATVGLPARPGDSLEWAGRRWHCHEQVLGAEDGLRALLLSPAEAQP